MVNTHPTGSVTDDELRQYAESVRETHNAERQEIGRKYDRCEHCGFTRHPCEVYEMAGSVIALLGRLDQS